MPTTDWYPFRRHLAIGTDGNLTENGELEIFDAETGEPVEVRARSGFGQPRGSGAVLPTVPVTGFATAEFEARAIEVYGQASGLSPIKMDSPEGIAAEAAKAASAAGGGVKSWMEIEELPDVPAEFTKAVAGLTAGDGVEFTPAGAAIEVRVEDRLTQAQLDATYAGRGEVATLAADALTADPTIAPALAAAASTAVDEVIATGPVGNVTWLDQYQPGEGYKRNALVAYQGGTWLKTTDPGTAQVVDYNYVPNPRFANNRQNWSMAGSGVSGSPTAGTWPLTLTAEKPANSLLVQMGSTTGQTATVAGEPWTAGFVAAVPADAPGPFVIRADLFTTGKTVAGPSVTVAPGQSARVTVTGTADDVGDAVYLRVYTGSATVPSGYRVTLSEPFLAPGTVAPDYFHGDTPDTSTVTHEWTSTVDNSPSKRTSIVPAPDDPPGQIGTTGWRLLATTSTTAPRAALTQQAGTSTAGTTADVPAFMSADRTHVWNTGGSALRVTHDDGATWTTVRTFTGESIEAVREVAGGELLVFTYRGDINRRRIWRSADYRSDGAAATWAQVMETRAPGIKFTSAWSISRNGDSLIMVNEYGPKMGEQWNGLTVADGENARYCYASFDAGRTWSTIFDLNAYLTSTGAALNGQHLHGVAWDPWWDRVWISYGDNTDAIIYSDNLGATWHHAAGSLALSSNSQVVGILPMPRAVLFGSDTGLSGVLRIDRAAGKAAGTYTLETAYVPEDPGHLCQAIYRADRPGQDAPAFFGFSSEGVAARSYVVATYDGFNFALVWRAADAQSAGYGVRSVIGPTLRGQLIVGMNVDGAWSKVTMPAPGY